MTPWTPLGDTRPGSVPQDVSFPSFPASPTGVTSGGTLQTTLSKSPQKFPEQQEPTDHQYLKRPIWSVGAISKQTIKKLRAFSKRFPWGILPVMFGGILRGILQCILWGDSPGDPPGGSSGGIHWGDPLGVLRGSIWGPSGVHLNICS